jgi:hypothetical protein
MAAGFRQISNTVTERKDEILANTRQLHIEQSDAHLQILSGQQDLQHNLQRLSQNISDSLQSNEVRTAIEMEKLFRKHQTAAQALMNAMAERSNDSMLVQIQHLVSNANLPCDIRVN